MGKRYYCDYCERSFIDDVESRKKHLNSVHHTRLRKAHYAANRDLAALIEEENKKDACRKFRTTGYCPYDEMCNFTHYSKQELQELSFRAEEQKKAAEVKLPSVEDWLKKREDKFADNADKNLQSDLLKMYDPLTLPPSLQPISVHHMMNTEFETWG